MLWLQSVDTPAVTEGVLSLSDRKHVPAELLEVVTEELFLLAVARVVAVAFGCF